MSGDEIQVTPWKNGVYRYKYNTLSVAKIEGQNASFPTIGSFDFEVSQQQRCTLKHGSFDKTPSDIAEKTGKDNYDVEFTFSTGMKMYAVLTENGSKIVLKSFLDSGKLEELTWMSSEELKDLIDSGDSLDAISCPYKIQPENKGKFLWLSGPPGAGKSTSAQLLSRNSGFVYYEGDCTMRDANPYIPSDVENPSMAQTRQKHLKGITKEHFEKIGLLKDYYFSLHNKSPNEELGKTGYKYMAECLKYERQRIGGDWVVAQAVPSRNMREVIRKVLGNDLIFIILSLKRETTLERLIKRHGDGAVAKTMTDVYMGFEEFYELKGENEENTFEITITKDMNPNIVAEKILEIVN